MSANAKTKHVPTTVEVSVNWEGLKRFMRWEGSIAELKKLELEQPDVPTTPDRAPR